MEEISLHLLDIIQNSIRAEARNITVTLEAIGDELILTICDDGTGMDEEFLKNVMDPFVTTRTTRKIGLGISLLKYSSEISGGEFHIHSKKGVGTKVIAKFKISHIDRIPLGDFSKTMVNLIMSYESVEFKVIFESSLNHFEFNTKETKGILQGVSISCIEVLEWIEEYLNEGIQNTFSGILNEIS